MKQYLYERDSKGKVRVLIIEAIQVDEAWEIRGKTGLLDGKLVDRPVITIHNGKVKRSAEEQCQLQLRAIISKKRDKGYRLLEDLPGYDVTRPIDYAIIDYLLPKHRTDTFGHLKPMLAKDVSEWKKLKYTRRWFLSRKLDGVRVMIKLVESRLVSISRGGKSYDAAMTKIFESPNIAKLIEDIAVLTTTPVEDITLDGELYIHGKPLHEISGMARKDVYEPSRHDALQFWVFDFGHPTLVAEQRCLILNNTSPLQDPRIKIVTHVECNNYDEMKVLHDSYVQEGFEGGIARDATKLYKYGGRDDRMIKLKEFKDDEFEIIGMVDGLRPEDMCFRCVTEDGKEFSAKPQGTREVREQYIKDIDSLIGKKLTVKFFNYTPEGIPFLPIGKNIREEGE